MKLKRNLWLVGICAIGVLALFVFKPQLSIAAKNQYILWHLDRLKADRYVITELPSQTHIQFFNDQQKFIFLFSGANDVSEKVSFANNFVSGWPDNKSECAPTLPGQHGCLIGEDTKPVTP